MDMNKKDFEQKLNEVSREYAVDLVDCNLEMCTLDEVERYYEDWLVDFDSYWIVENRMDEELQDMFYTDEEHYCNLILDLVENNIMEYIIELKLEDTLDNDPLLEGHLEIYKEENGDDINLVREVEEYLYLSVLSPSTEGCDDLVSSWCKEHQDQIVKRIEEFNL